MFSLAVLTRTLSTFAIPKQNPLHFEREKEGLDCHTRVGKECYDAINYPGVRIVPTQDEWDLVADIKAARQAGPRQWSELQQIIADYSGYSPVVFNVAMQSALECRRYQEGANMFRHLQEAKAPMNLPIYTTAIKLYGKLGRQEEVNKLWQQMVGLDRVGQVNAAACIDAFAGNGNITGAGEVLEYMENESVEVNMQHFSSAINACANSDEAYRGKAAQFLFKGMLERKLQPNIVTYTNLLRALRRSPGQDLLDILSDMKTRGVTANVVFAENFFYTFLKQPRKGCWRNEEDIASDIRKLPKGDLQTAKAKMDDFVSAGVKLNASCRRIKAALESLL
eukprot:Skav205904  [mRNA]  locus=scaffold123:385529:386539:+ [translate_table: standard]